MFEAKDVEVWRGTHVFLHEIERLSNRKLPKLREMRDLIDGVQVSIRIPKSEWKKYGIDKAMTMLGMDNRNSIYVNL